MHWFGNRLELLKRDILYVVNSIHYRLEGLAFNNHNPYICNPCLHASYG